MRRVPLNQVVDYMDDAEERKSASQAQEATQPVNELPATFAGKQATQPKQFERPLDKLYRELFDEDYFEDYEKNAKLSGQMAQAALCDDSKFIKKEIDEPDINNLSMLASQKQRVYVSNCVPKAEDNWASHKLLSRGIPYYKMPVVKLKEKEAKELM